MKKRNLWIAGGILIIVLAIALVLFYRSSRLILVPKGQDYRIGVLYPLTGPAAAIGESNKNGVLMAIEDINSRGGVNGRKLIAILGDTKGDPKEAISEFNRMTTLQNVKVVVTAISSVSLALAPIADEKKVILFADASHPDITKGRSYVFRNFPTADLETKPVAEFLNNIIPRIRAIAILVQNDDYGRGLSTSLKASLQSTAVTYEDSFERTATDFRGQVQKVIDSGVQAVYVGGFGKSLGILIKQLRERQFKGQVFASLGFLVADARAAAGEAAEGVYCAVPIFEFSRSERVRLFKQRYKAKFGSEPPFNAALTYDTVHLLARALSVSKGFSSESIRKALLGIQNFDGVSGKLSVQPNGDVVSEMTLGRIASGNVVPIFHTGK